MEEEKRGSGRLSVKLIANCTTQWDKTYSNDDFICYAKDISNCGACFVVSRELKPNVCLAIRLDLPPYFMPVLVYGRVVWVRELNITRPDMPKIAEVGIRFFRLEQFDREKLDNFLIDSRTELQGLQTKRQHIFS